MTGIIAVLAAIAPTRISITDREAYNIGSGGPVTSTYTIASGGMVKVNGSTVETWLVGGVASSFEVRATLQSGILSAGTTGSWLSCSTDRSWAVTATGVIGAIFSAVILVEIREAGSGIVRDTATITITAEKG